MEHKKTTAWFLKAPAEGRVLARFATLGGAPDLDGDILAAGSIGEQFVRVSAYGHASWSGELPVGRGRVFERQNEALAELEFFLQTTSGRDHWETLRGLGDLAEWSMGFDVIESEPPDEAQRAAGALRVLKKLKIHEVSPVLRGAGISTRTLSMKCTDCGAPVSRRNLSPASVFHAAEATVAAAGKLLGSGPDAELARFAAYCGHQLNNCPHRIRPPEVRWFDTESVPATAGWMTPEKKDVTWVLEGLSGEALVRTVLHESRHHAQDDPRAWPAEEDAAAFAAKWTGPVWAAYRWSNGEAHRVRVTGDREPPFLGVHRNGDIMLQKGRARAWAYITTAVTGPWLTIG